MKTHSQLGLLEHSPLAIVVVDGGTGRIVAANAAAHAQYGYAAEEMRSLTASDLVVEQTARQHPARHRAKDGRHLWVETCEHSATLDGQRVRVLVLHEVTQRIHTAEAALAAQEECQHRQRIAAVHRVASRMAQDFENVLSSIAASVAASQDALRPGSPPREPLEPAIEAIRRARAVSAQLVGPVRGPVAQLPVVDMTDHVSSLEQALLQVTGDGINLRLRLTESAGRVRMEPRHLDIIVWNLVANARDAMPSGGTLTIEVDDETVHPLYGGDRAGSEAAAYVRVTVTDTGVGMDDDARGRLFEPFFSTKASDEASGLGLSMVYRIVSANGGYLTVETAPGQGCRVCVRIPCAEPGHALVSAPDPSMDPAG